MRYTFVVLPGLWLSLANADLLDTIVITETPPPAVGEVEPTEYSGSVTRLNRDELVNSHVALAAAVGRAAGVQYRQAGAPGSYSSVSMRGSSSAQTNVYMDGVLLNNATDGSLDLSTIDLLNLTGVDIYRGTTPVQLASAGIGGAVNLLSYSGQQPQPSVQLGYGSFNSRAGRFALQNRIGRWSFNGAVSLRSADNQFAFNNDNATPLNPVDDRIEKRNNADYLQNSALVKMNADLEDSVSIDSLLQLGERRHGIPHWRNRAENEAELSTDTLQWQVNRRRKGSEADPWNQHTALFFNQNRETYDDSDNQIGLLAQYGISDSRVVGMRGYWDYPMQTGTFAISVEGRSEELEHEDRIANTSYRAERQQANTALQFSRYFNNDRWMVSPALRWVTTRDRLDGITRQGADLWRSSEITAQLGVVWQFDEQVRFFANLGQYRREPVFFELFGDRGLFQGNPDLSAESGINSDIGFEWQSLQCPRCRFGITAFNGLRDELIVVTYNSRGVGRSENSGAAQAFGIESFFNWRWTHAIETDLSLTWQSTENQSEFVAYRGKRLPGEAGFSAALELRYQRQRLNLWYQSELSQDRYYDLVNALPAEDQFLHHIGFDYRQRNTTWSLSINNLSDQNVEDFNGFPKPGLSVFFSVTYQPLKG